MGCRFDLRRIVPGSCQGGEEGAGRGRGAVKELGSVQRAVRSGPVVYIVFWVAGAPKVTLSEAMSLGFPSGIIR